jgi:hypothetical protein
MFHVEHFWFRPNKSTEEAAPAFAEALLVWIQSEEKDEADRVAVLRKMVKNIRWLAQKVGTSIVILHSFAHLGESKAKSEFADALIDEAALRLRDREYVVHIVPFGAFHEFKMHVKGPSLNESRSGCILTSQSEILGINPGNGIFRL